MKNSILTFNISGDYAMFKKPWANNQHQSYYIPPKTTIVGMISGILGFKKNEYIDKLPFESIFIGVMVLKKPTRELIGYNFMHGKNLRSRLKKLSNPYRNPTSKGSLSPTRIEYLKNVSYKLFIYIKDEGIMGKLKKLLFNNKCHFPPFLGQANLFAEISEVFTGEFVETNNIEYIETVAPSKIINNESVQNGLFRIEKMPYKFSTERTNPEYISLIFTEDPKDKLKIKREFKNNEYLIGTVNYKDNEIGVVLY